MRYMLSSLAVALAIFWATLVLAQSSDGTAPDYAAWEDLAAVAERTVDSDEAENDALEVLRQSLVNFRQQFEAARALNAPRIASLNDQLSALGPVPENGEEPREVAERRAELERSLLELQAPQQVAEEAFLRADGLIGEIDAIVRERQAERLLLLGPSPLNPVHWPMAVSDVKTIVGDIVEDARKISEMNASQDIQDNLPLILLMTVAALTFIVRGRRWAGIALEKLRKWGGRGLGVWRFLVSLLRIVIPLVGLLLLMSALRITGVTGDRIDQILVAIPIWGFVLLGFRWLAERIFARDPDDALLQLPDEARRKARFYLLLISILFVTRGLIEVLMSLDDVDIATTAVLAFPVVVAMGVVLFFFGFLLRSYRIEEEDIDQDDEDAAPDDTVRGSGLARVVRIAGTATIVVSIVGPVMAGVGYAEAGNALLYPTVVSLALAAFVLALQRFLSDLYGLVTGQGAAARDALVPALIGFLLVLMSVPVFALIWGARVADLTELWAMFSRGFAIGDTRISPTDFLTFAVIFAVGFTATRMVQGTLRQNVLPKTRMDIGGQNAVVSGTGYVGIFLSALVAITGAGIDLSTFAIVAGALSVGIGFGLRTIVENFVSGIILLIGRPISEGDWIEVGGRMGYVRDISVRSTRIETFEKTDVIVPNADLVSGTVTNYTRGNTVGRLTVSVGVAYGTDTRKVDRILREIAEAQPMVLRKPQVMVVFQAFGADALEFEVRMFLRDINWIMAVKSDINHEIAERFAKEGIEVPFAQRDIWLRNPESLQSVGPKPVASDDTPDALEVGDETAPDGTAGDETSEEKHDH